jgi:hypothetical protein
VRAARVKDGWAVHHLLHVVFRGRDVETEEKAKAEEPRTPLDAPLAQVDPIPVGEGGAEGSRLSKRRHCSKTLVANQSLPALARLVAHVLIYSHRGRRNNVQALLLPVVALKRAGYYLSSKALYYVRLWSFVLYAVPHWVLVVEKATERKGGVVGSCDLTLMPASATVPVLEALRDAQQVPRGRQVPRPAAWKPLAALAKPKPAPPPTIEPSSWWKSQSATRLPTLRSGVWFLSDTLRCNENHAGVVPVQHGGGSARSEVRCRVRAAALRHRASRQAAGDTVALVCLPLALRLPTSRV